MSIPSQLEIETFCNLKKKCERHRCDLKNAKEILVKRDKLYSQYKSYSHYKIARLRFERIWQDIVWDAHKTLHQFKTSFHRFGYVLNIDIKKKISPQKFVQFQYFFSFLTVDHLYNFVLVNDRNTVHTKIAAV